MSLKLVLLYYKIMNMNYSEALQYLYNSMPVFHLTGADAYKPGFTNTLKLMDLTMHPYLNYKTIHVGGTNGKGSVSNLLSAVLQSAGYKIGLYTSPHLVDFSERIKVNGKPIDNQYVINYIEKYNVDFELINPSFFEVTMAMAFSYFSDQQVDIAIIEVGLGGRLDSTNIIKPEVSVITNISFDHVAFLGDTLQKIAFEKAGIIKPKTPVVIGEFNEATYKVFTNAASQNKSEIYYAENEVVIKVIEQSIDKLHLSINNEDVFEVGLGGTYQIKNISTVYKTIQILQKLNFQISKSDIYKGFKSVTELTGFMGRWQCFGINPLIICDTAHNEAGIGEISNHLKSLKFKILRIVFGMVNDKDISSVLKLLPSDAMYYFTNANIARALPANELQIQASKHGLVGNSYSIVELAVLDAINSASPDDLVLIIGSNFIVGEAILTLKQKQSNI